MADNVIANSGDGLGPTFAADDIGGVKFPRVKLIIGADGTNDGDVSSSNPIPVLGTVTVTDGSGSLTVDNGGTFATQATIAAGATNIAKAEDAASANADVGVPAMAIQKASPADTAGTDGDYAMLQMSGGRLWVDPSGVTLTVASHAVTNAGTFATQESGALLTSAQLIDDIIFAEDAASSNGDKGAVVLAKRSDTAAATSGTDGDYEPLQVSGGKLHATIEPIATGGWDVFMATSGDGSTALTATAQAVKASAGKLGGWYIYNPNASATYVILYNTAQGSVTVGTTNPLMVLCIPATSAANLESANGIAFSTAISVAATTTGGGNTAPGTALEAVFWYK